MPTRAPRCCPTTGCAGLAYNHGPCEACKAERPARSAETAARDRFYHSAEWLRFRAWFLATTCEQAGCQHKAEHQLCQDCHDAGRVTQAKDVDHIKPRSQGGAPLDATNVRGLCRPCHSRRTMRDHVRPLRGAA